MDSMEKYQELLERLRAYGKLCVAYSGGADSTLLLKAAIDALSKENVIAVIAETDFFSKVETENAKKIAEELGVTCCSISIDVLHMPQIANNELNRCYHCKKMIFTDILKTAFIYGIKTVADGTIMEDSEVYRPGSVAQTELGIVKPLYDCGMYKVDVRSISEQLGLPTWNKPTNSCLVTRFPYETEITKEKLEIIERAEDFLKGFGLGVLRFRSHGEIARIEVNPCDFDMIVGNTELTDFIKSLGYRFVTLDLEGFRSCSMDYEAGE